MAQPPVSDGAPFRVVHKVGVAPKLDIERATTADAILGYAMNGVNFEGTRDYAVLSCLKGSSCRLSRRHENGLGLAGADEA